MKPIIINDMAQLKSALLLRDYFDTLKAIDSFHAAPNKLYRDAPTIRRPYSVASMFQQQAVAMDTTTAQERTIVWINEACHIDMAAFSEIARRDKLNGTFIDHNKNLT